MMARLRNLLSPPPASLYRSLVRGTALGSLVYAAWWLSAAVFLIGASPVENWDYIWWCIRQALAPGALGLLLWENDRLRHRRPAFSLVINGAPAGPTGAEIGRQLRRWLDEAEQAARGSR